MKLVLVELSLRGAKAKPGCGFKRIAYTGRWALAFLALIACSAIHAQTEHAANTQPANTVKPAASSPPSDSVPATSVDARHAPPPGVTSNEPASLFDAGAAAISVVTQTVRVHAPGADPLSAEPLPLVAGGQEIISAAGSYGDLMRFLQGLPGVEAVSDSSNDVLVRGGHPMENLYLVDGIEVPNLNHLSTLGTTGGFAPMIDSSLVQDIRLFTGGYGARYPERLSSVTEVSLLRPPQQTRRMETDIGIEGAGGLLEQRFGQFDLLTSGHRGLLDVFTKDAGLNGVPSYTDEVTRLRRDTGSGDRLTILNIAGWDSIDVTPCQSDSWQTSEISSQYSGWRETSGITWQHVYSQHAFGVLSASDSEQVEHLQQFDEFLNPANAQEDGVACPAPAPNVSRYPVYLENSNSAFTTAGYRVNVVGQRISFHAGTALWDQRPNDAIQQPAGAFSPYSISPVRADSANFAADLSTLETGTFAETNFRPVKTLLLSAGGRLQTFAFGNHTTLTPRLSLRFSPFESLSFHASYAAYAQLPPYVYLLSYPQNHTLSPMWATHQLIGMDVTGLAHSEFRVEAYTKTYGHTPASTEYPTVTLHEMASLLGEQFVWLPMNSAGRGRSAGIEVSNVSHLGSRALIRGSVAYARAKFAGQDGVFRPSNFDMPWIVNASGIVRLGHGYTVSSRYGFASGRPYTPFDMKDSIAQNRPIYDLASVNARRAPFYSRLDGQLSKEVSLHDWRLELYGGVNNILNRDNFLGYAWMPLYLAQDPTAIPVKELHQMPIFPNFGIRFLLHEPNAVR